MKEKLNKGIKVRIFPDEEQVGQIRLSFMWARNFYNYLVEYQKDYTKAIWIMRDQEGGYRKDKIRMVKFYYLTRRVMKVKLVNLSLSIRGMYI